MIGGGKRGAKRYTQGSREENDKARVKMMKRADREERTIQKEAIGVEEENGIVFLSTEKKDRVRLFSAIR